MGDWYTIGIACGLAVGCGVLAGGALAVLRLGALLAAVLALAAGVVIGFVVWNWDEALGGALGGLAGAAGAGQVARGALRRGGTPGSTAVLVGTAGVALAALALLPGVGYAEALALPALAARLRRRAGERYAGLRILARD